MSLVRDFYVPGHSWLHQLDPRVKLWGVTVGVLAAFALPGWGPQVALLLGMHLLLRSAGISWGVLRAIWRQMALLVIIILLLQPFFSPDGAAIVAWGPLQWTWGGIHAAAVLALRALAIAFISGGLLLTTSPPALVRALVRLGLPYHWGFTISLTLRFLPTIHALFLAVRDAQAARGWVTEGHLWRRLRGYLPVLVAVVVNTLRMSDQLTLALAARGLGADSRRTTWRDLRMRRLDWGVLALLTLASGVIVVGWWGRL